MGQTLSEFFRAVFTPLRIEATQMNGKTAQGYRETVAWWVKLTGDPPLTEVDDLRVAAFVAELGRQKGKRGPTMMKSSVAKHCMNLGSVLRIAGPRAQHRQGQGVIPFVPWVPTPKLEAKPPDGDWSIDEIRAMFAACRGATHPKIEGVEPREWWETFIVFDYFTGLRIKSAISATYSMIQGDWLLLPAAIMKQGHSLKQFLHPTAKEYIERIRRTGREEIVPWPKWESSRSAAYGQLREIQTSAGIEEHRRFAFHSFRKTHATQLQETAFDHDQTLKITQRSVGHSDSRITTGHYISGAVQDRLLAAQILQMPSPLPQVDRVRRDVPPAERQRPRQAPAERTDPDWLD